MPKVSIGKLLLRNVIRHTDAHNKIQEESEMWKLRGLETQASTISSPKHRGSMHCDRYLDSSEESMQDRKKDISESDEKEARYWTRKLYEFEAGDPDRWGHSGFKELYPEEFNSDREKDTSENKHRRKKHRNGDKKVSKKKKKKEKKKKRRKNEGSASEACGDVEDVIRKKQRRKSKRSKKEHRDKEATRDSQSEMRTRTHRKRGGSEKDSVSEPQRKKRKNWKAANEERSEESSEA